MAINLHEISHLRWAPTWRTLFAQMYDVSRKPRVGLGDYRNTRNRLLDDHERKHCKRNFLLHLDQQIASPSSGQRRPANERDHSANTAGFLEESFRSHPQKLKAARRSYQIAVQQIALNIKTDGNFGAGQHIEYEYTSRSFSL